MGYKSIQIKVPTDYSEEQLRSIIGKQMGIKEFSFQIEKKSLDARKKNDTHWLLGLIVSSEGIEGDEFVAAETLKIPHKKRSEKVSNGIELKKGRPVNVNSKRQVELAKKAEKVVSE